MDPRSAPSPFTFGSFIVNAGSRTIHKGKIRLKLHRQPFDVLLMLLERSGEVVTREELEAKLWPGTAFVDSEHGLNTAVKKLRRVLGDSADEPQFIETVPRIGYRFIGEARQEQIGEAANRSAADGPIADLRNTTSTRSLAAKEAPAAAKTSPRTSLGRSRGFWLTTVASAVAIVLVAYLWSVQPWQKPATAAKRSMVAVLPFKNLTGDPAQEYFSDGLTEEMIDQLGRVAPEQFGVIARTTVEQYKNHTQPLAEIEAQLGAKYVLEGSVRRDARDVRIAAQLVQARDQKVIWARQYDRELTSLLALQSEIAGEIADEIQLTLGEGHRAAPLSTSLNAPSYEAYDLYLQGRFFLNNKDCGWFSAGG